MGRQAAPSPFQGTRTHTTCCSTSPNPGRGKNAMSSRGEQRKDAVQARDHPFRDGRIISARHRVESVAVDPI